MQQYLYIIILLILPYLHQQSATEIMKWSAEEVAAANTGKDAIYLNDVEKETLLYLNLARLYPKKYVRLEVPKDIFMVRNEKAKWFSYRNSLVKELNSIQPLEPYYPNEYMTLNAKCFAKESAELGIVGHQRVKCEKENYAECCAYGKKTGREIALQLLIDYDVPSLGHRNDCLAHVYSKVGLGYEEAHPRYGSTLVMVLD
ncbi:CAP domain-containing protein [Pontibacter pamirensis]|uniref:CAP domain-containing protein n=1 Tax=Pontibacter pamirensis TaxID=2562824 RepID=UPI001389B408|nr:CAP domain-containing protein [Pontibacter pamirensis]